MSNVPHILFMIAEWGKGDDQIIAYPIGGGTQEKCEWMREIIQDVINVMVEEGIVLINDKYRLKIAAIEPGKDSPALQELAAGEMTRF